MLAQRAGLRPTLHAARSRKSSAAGGFLITGRSRAAHVCHVATKSVEFSDLVGMQAPPFLLKDAVTKQDVSLEQFSDRPALLVIFMCVHCPYTSTLKAGIAELAVEYQAKGVAVVAVSSNNIQSHPQDAPEHMAKDAARFGYTFPFLFDETQEVAKAYSAASTPEFYVFDAQRQLAYHGQFDDNRLCMEAFPPVQSGHSLRAALDAVLAGKPASPSQPSIGCNIKWRPGTEPSYFTKQVV
mmetsp:Transcript_4495/g.7576  ORF Transcript_4495/g.7576 Transcript_4495/m.7576 type:complete len:240 (+) Transcript_4495:38-757(+)